MQVLKRDLTMSEKANTKETRKSREKLRDLDMPSDPKDLARAMFQAADRKVKEKQLRKSRRVI